MTAGRPEPWLVVIDMQHVFADAESPWGMADFDTVVPTITALIEKFADRTVLTRFVAPAQPWGSWRDYYAEWPFALTAEAAPLWEIVPSIAVAGSPVIDAPTMSKWTDDLLAVTGGSLDIVLCGVSTDCCVLSTALAASDAGAYVRVVADACAGLSPQSHQLALDAMAVYRPQIEIVRAADVT